MATARCALRAAKPPHRCLGSSVHTTLFVQVFDITLVPDEGYFQGGAFLFAFTIPESYPHDPPRVKCLTKVGLLWLVGLGWGFWVLGQAERGPPAHSHMPCTATGVLLPFLLKPSVGSCCWLPGRSCLTSNHPVGGQSPGTHSHCTLGFIAGVPPQHRHRGACGPQHHLRGLDAHQQYQNGHLWPQSPVPAASHRCVVPHAIVTALQWLNVHDTVPLGVMDGVERGAGPFWPSLPIREAGAAGRGCSSPSCALR